MHGYTRTGKKIEPRLTCDCGRKATMGYGSLRICERCHRIQQKGGYNNDWVERRCRRVTDEQRYAARCAKPYTLNLAFES